MVSDVRDKQFENLQAMSSKENKCYRLTYSG